MASWDLEITRELYLPNYSNIPINFMIIFQNTWCIATDVINNLFVLLFVATGVTLSLFVVVFVTDWQWHL